MGHAHDQQRLESIVDASFGNGGDSELQVGQPGRQSQATPEVGEVVYERYADGRDGDSTFISSCSAPSVS